MAIGLFGSKGEKGNASPDRNSSDDKKDVELGGVDRPKRRSITADDMSGEDISVGKQMEMEADNAIKYRTCSWQKVRSV